MEFIVTICFPKLHMELDLGNTYANSGMNSIRTHTWYLAVGHASNFGKSGLRIVC